MMKPKLLTPAMPNCRLSPRQAMASTAPYTSNVMRYVIWLLAPGAQQARRPHGEHGEQHHERDHVLVRGHDIGGADLGRDADEQGAEHGTVGMTRPAEEDRGQDEDDEQVGARGTETADVDSEDRAREAGERAGHRPGGGDHPAGPDAAVAG